MEREGGVRIAPGRHAGRDPVLGRGLAWLPRIKCTFHPQKIGVALACASCLLVACKTVESVTPPRVTLGGQVRFSLSGGFAGIRQHLTIDDTGRIQVRDERRGKTVHGQLDPARLAAIRAAFMNIDPEAGPVKTPMDTRCRDCLYCSIQATVDGRHHRASAATTFSHSPYGELAASLSRILHETLGQPSNMSK